MLFLCVPLRNSNAIQEIDDEILDKSKRRDRDIPLWIYSPLLGGSPDTTPNIISISISIVSSFPSLTPN